MWVLRLRRVRTSDSGIYICELNSTPKKKVSRILAVTDDDMGVPSGGIGGNGAGGSVSILEVDHNYTDCCVREAVPQQCHHFCHFRGLLTDNQPQGTVHSCINHLSSITKCLADGRDHMPCCRKQNIPETCRPVCVGNFSLTTVLDHFTCMHYTAPVLACIAEGVQILPPPVDDITVDPVSSTSVNVSWSLPRPASKAALIESIQVNVTQLHTFDGVGVRLAPEKASGDGSGNSGKGSESDGGGSHEEPPSLYGLQMRYSVAGNESFFLIPDLKPYTMYEIQVKSINRAGSSLSSNPVRTLTLLPESDKGQDPKDKKNKKHTTAGSHDEESSRGNKERESLTPSRDKESADEDEEKKSNKKATEEDKKKSSGAEKEGESESSTASSTSSSSSKKKTNTLPDIKSCCRSKGVVIDRCVNILCDPVRSDEASLTDLMICAPFANVTFSCVTDGVDHTPCCRSRGVSPNCLELCSGQVKKIDFRHFVCLDQLPSFSSCVLDHHGVLPGTPSNFMVVNVHHDWAIVKWNPPKESSSPPVTKYLIHYRDVNRDDPSSYSVATAKSSPFLLDKLSPGGRYEVYVKAANEYGTSQGSSRVVFSTPPVYSNDEVEAELSSTAYNETQCCTRAGLSNECLPLCSYRVKVTDVLQRASACAQNLPTLVRCGAGGRNHIPCCRRRGVTDGCLNICAGLVESSPYVVAARCADDLGKILQCMEEGSGLLPGMPVDFHATLVTKDTMHLEWEPAPEDVNMTIDFQVRYGKADSDIPLHPLEHTSSVNTTQPNVILTGLEPNTRYSLYVVGSNSYGISLPSLVLIVNTTSANGGQDSKMISSNMGPPHAIQVLHQSTDTITFKWMPPLYVPPDSKVKYIVHYKAVNGTAVEKGLPVSKDWQLIETTFNTMFLMNLTFDTEYAITIQAINDRNREMRSSLSEVALVWTDPAIPASVNLPVIIPAGPIIEGSNVTFMCIGVGTPTPTLSLLLNGQEVMRQERRHISLTVLNVRRNLTSVSCYATNGFTNGRSSQAAQSTLELRVRFKPSIWPSPSVTHITRGGPGRLQCQFSGNPQPHVVWFKDMADGKQEQVPPSTKVSFVTVTHSDLSTMWINSMVFKSVNDSDAGDYHCMAINDLGQEAVSLELYVDAAKNNSATQARDCCRALSVHPECQKVCSFDVDIDQALGIAECFPDLDKLMTCAADGSDHRTCCRRRGVPSDCIRWCAGLKVTKPNLCSLSSAHDIVACFQEGKALLPGPPLNVHARRILDNEDNKVIIEWTPPKKNPELVQYYRVFWRPVGSRDLNRNQTEEAYFQLEGLDPDKMYEFVVKSGNHYGLSIFTDPLVISMASVRASSSSSSVGGQLMRVVLSVCLTAVIVITTGALVVFVYRNYLPRIRTMRFRGGSSGGSGRGSVLSSPSISSFSSTRGVSFENPSYMKDTTPSVQFNAPSNEVEVNANFPDHKMITLTTTT